MASFGTFTVVTPSLDRQFSMDAFAALPESHLMVALLELDVTNAEAAIEAMRARGERVSLFAFLVRAIAATIAEHPDLNLVRHGRRFVRFDDVDVSVPVEVKTEGGHYPREVVLRRAQDRTATELFTQIEEARTGFARSGVLSREDHWNRRLMAALGWTPRWLRIALMRWVMRSAYRIKTRAGTTLVTSVGKFASISGHVFTFTTGPRAATFAIGSVVQKPWAHEGTVALRSIQSLSIMIDHDLVDGGPAARFAKRLAERIESAEGLG
jgi:pyruvate/2-oxoglutarate dehydrogenase complex dihydrolipoamide acyltransferase (E2) component